MRSIFTYLELNFEEVKAYLDSLYPHRSSSGWIFPNEEDPILYIELTNELDSDFEEDIPKITKILGQNFCAVLVDVSGRHQGGVEVRDFVIDILNHFNGVAQDDYSDHFWTLEDIKLDKKIDGNQFFNPAENIK